MYLFKIGFSLFMEISYVQFSLADEVLFSNKMNDITSSIVSYDPLSISFWDGLDLFYMIC